jgi:hypothetical protein
MTFIGRCAFYFYTKTTFFYKNKPFTHSNLPFTQLDLRNPNICRTFVLSKRNKW